MATTSKSGSSSRSGSKSRSATKSDSTVPARVEQEQANPNDNADEVAKRQEEQAREQEAQQKDELRAGKKSGAAEALPTIPEQRAGMPGARPIGGRVDNMTRRDDRDVLDGHMCYIDYSADDGGKDAKQAVAAALGEQALGGREPGVGVADYGVYLGPASINPDDGYPQTGIVFLRDEFAAQVVVPYSALRPAPQGGRR